MSDFRAFVESVKEILSEEPNVDKMIKDLSKDFGGSNEDQLAGVQLLKGLAVSDDPMANKFMKELDKATTQISQKLRRGKNEELDEAMYRPNSPKYKSMKKKGSKWYEAYKNELKKLAPEAVTGRMDWDSATHMMNQGMSPQDAAKKYVDKVLKK